MKALKFIKRGSTTKNSALVLLGNIISQITGFFVIVIIGRGLSVSDYGIYSVLNNISSFVTDLADMGMNGATTRFVAEYHSKEDYDLESALILYSMRRKILNIVIVFTILVIGARPIAKYMLHDEIHYKWVYLVIVTCAVSLMIGAFRAILQGRQSFSRYFISMALWNIVWWLGIFIINYLGMLDVTTSLFAGVLSGIINLLLCLRFVDYHQIKKTKSIPDEIRKKFNEFGFWMALWALCAILQSRMDIFLLASLTTTEQVSYYDIAIKLTKPVLMVASAYSQVLNPQFASLNTQAEVSSRIKRLIKYVSLISLFIVACIIIVEPVVFVVFGHKYDSSIIPSRLLLFADGFFVWTIPYNSALYAMNKPFIFTIAAFAGLIVTVIGDLLLLGKYGAIGAAVTFILAQIIGLVVAIVSYNIIKNKDKRKND